MSPAPGDLDFSAGGNVPGGVDYATLAPLLKQVFFVGDGLTSGGEQQQLIVPAGATRLFLGTMDGFEWVNNFGSFTVHVAPAVAVPEPSTLALVGLGSLMLLRYGRLARRK